MSETTAADIKRAVLVGIRDGKMSKNEADTLARELDSLVQTLGLETAALEMVHVREKSAKYGMGTGKAAELAEKAKELEADCIIFDRDISPSQQRNWEELAGIPVIDRQELIIQIFADRARTKEAELQISLAELKYALPGGTEIRPPQAPAQVYRPVPAKGRALRNKGFRRNPF